jgi:hypothetical protein
MTRDDKISVWNPVVPADVNDTDIAFNNEVITMSSMRDFNEDKNLGFELGMWSLNAASFYYESILL